MQIFTNINIKGRYITEWSKIIIKYKININLFAVCIVVFYWGNRKPRGVVTQSDVATLWLLLFSSYPAECPAQREKDVFELVG